MFYFDFHMFFKHMWSEQIRNSLIIIGALIIFAVIFGRYLNKINPNKKPPKIVVVFEELVKLVNGLVKMTIGKRWKSYAPYILTIFIYLLVANISGLFLLTPPATSWNVTLGIALISFSMIHYTGVRSLGVKKYLAEYTSPLPPYIPVLLPLNVLSEIVFPFSLSLRLFGNILSGAVISILIYGLLPSLGMVGFVLLIFMPIFHFIFDLFFGAIQAVVFMLLTSIFIGQKVDESEMIEE